MINVIGIGPGSLDMMTYQAVKAIEESQVIVGYKTYIDLILPLIKEKEVVSNGMRQEIERCRQAIEIAKTGKTVAVISSGDAGVYGMAGLVLELASEQGLHDMKIEIIPGVTASTAAASILGSPLMHDFCHISLSDLLTPIELIYKRTELAAQADFVICFYNPRSKGRENHLRDAFELIKKHKSSDTPVGIVKNAGRENMVRTLTTLADIDYSIVDMTSIVIVGNKSTYIADDLMLTPRGYEI